MTPPYTHGIDYESWDSQRELPECFPIFCGERRKKVFHAIKQISEQTALICCSFINESSLSTETEAVFAHTQNSRLKYLKQDTKNTKNIEKLKGKKGYFTPHLIGAKQAHISQHKSQITVCFLIKLS